jgi:hypothetical protein
MMVTNGDDRHQVSLKKRDIMVQIEKNSVPLRGNLVLTRHSGDDRHQSSPLWITPNG